MKVKLTKKEIKFLVGILGPMHEEDFIENIQRNFSLKKNEKDKIVEFVNDLGYSILFSKLNSINRKKTCI